MLKFTQYSCNSDCPEPYNKTEDLLKHPLLQPHALTYAQIGAGLSWRQKQMLVSPSARNGCRRNP